MKTHYKALGDHGTLGIQIVLCVLFGSWGGHWLDEKFHTAPVLMVIGFCFGLGAAGKSVYESWQQMQKAAEREEREQGNPAPRWEKRDDASEQKKADDDRVAANEDEDDHGQK